MKILKLLFFFFGLLEASMIGAQTKLGDVVTPRARVIIDNDFNGDPDGLFQLVHHLLSPSVEVRGIIGGHMGADDRGFVDDGSGQPCAVQAATIVKDVLKVMGKSDVCPVVPGALKPMQNPNEPIDSEGARLIIKEAMRTDVNTPLYVVCGASLSNIASAWLLEPRIADRVVLVWIGGQEYPGAIVPPGYSTPEYNLNLSIAAGQTVFNLSNLKLWQIPRDAYRQCMYSLAELIVDVEPCGEIGKYLADKLLQTIKNFNTWMNMGEAYVLGDSPLVLLTALQSSWESDAAGCHYSLKAAPLIANDGTYRHNHNGRTIRVYDFIDTRMMFSDMIAKLKMWKKK